KELEHVIEINDEVDPILVIKLKGVGFVCVDGHHSIAAYKAKGKKTITCEWFPGSVREAMNACMERNTKIKLNLPKHARFEEAWKRTLMKEGSKDEVRRLCVVGEGTVALMRRVMNEAMGNAEPDKVKRCRERLHIRQNVSTEKALETLKTRQWAMVRLDYAGLDAGEEMTLERKVANLARRLQSRFQNHRLSREPEVTARALMVYDRHL